MEEPVKPEEPIAPQGEPQETPLPDEMGDDEPTLILEPEAEEAIAQFTTAIYVAMGLNTCPVCGDKKRVGTDGEPICSVNREDCPNVDSHSG